MHGPFKTKPQYYNPKKIHDSPEKNLLNSCSLFDFESSYFSPARNEIFEDYNPGMYQLSKDSLHFSDDDEIYQNDRPIKLSSHTQQESYLQQTPPKNFQRLDYNESRAPPHFGKYANNYTNQHLTAPKKKEYPTSTADFTANTTKKNVHFDNLKNTARTNKLYEDENDFQNPQNIILTDRRYHIIDGCNNHSLHFPQDDSPTRSNELFAEALNPCSWMDNEPKKKFKASPEKLRKDQQKSTHSHYASPLKYKNLNKNSINAYFAQPQKNFVVENKKFNPQESMNIKKKDKIDHFSQPETIKIVDENNQRSKSPVKDSQFMVIDDNNQRNSSPYNNNRFMMQKQNNQRNTSPFNNNQFMMQKQNDQRSRSPHIDDQPMMQKQNNQRNTSPYNNNQFMMQKQNDQRSRSPYIDDQPMMKKQNNQQSKSPYKEGQLRMEKEDNQRSKSPYNDIQLRMQKEDNQRNMLPLKDNQLNLLKENLSIKQKINNIYDKLNEIENFIKKDYSKMTDKNQEQIQKIYGETSNVLKKNMSNQNLNKSNRPLQNSPQTLRKKSQTRQPDPNSDAEDYADTNYYDNHDTEKKSRNSPFRHKHQENTFEPSSLAKNSATQSRSSSQSKNYPGQGVNTIGGQQKNNNNLTFGLKSSSDPGEDKKINEIFEERQGRSQLRSQSPNKIKNSSNAEEANKKTGLNSNTIKVNDKISSGNLRPQEKISPTKSKTNEENLEPKEYKSTQKLKNEEGETNNKKNNIPSTEEKAEKIQSSNNYVSFQAPQNETKNELADKNSRQLSHRENEPMTKQELRLNVRPYVNHLKSKKQRPNYIVDQFKSYEKMN